MVPEGSVYRQGEETFQHSYPVVNVQPIITTELAVYAQWYKSGRNVMGVTTHFLIGFKAHSRASDLAYHFYWFLLLLFWFFVLLLWLLLFCFETR